MAVVDIRMPPTHTDEGLLVAADPRAPSGDGGGAAQPVPGAALRRAAAREQPGGLGYLLKERVSDIAVLVDALHSVADGRVRPGPDDRPRLMRRRRRRDSPLDQLTSREHEVLALMAEGRSNGGIAQGAGGPREDRGVGLRLRSFMKLSWSPRRTSTGVCARC